MISDDFIDGTLVYEMRTAADHLRRDLDRWMDAATFGADAIDNTLVQGELDGIDKAARHLLIRMDAVRALFDAIKD